MKPMQQINKWVEGESIHNDERDECCPDFSCCHNEVKTDQATRKRFRKAYLEGDDEIQNEMLMMFLGAALKNENVYIVGSESDGSVIQ